MFENRYLEIASILKELKNQKNEEKKIGRLLNELIRAPHFMVEMDPASTVKSLNQDREGFEQFFAFPYDRFILDFPPLPNIRDRNFSPFIYLRRLDEDKFYVQSFTNMKDVDRELWINSVFSPETAGAQIGNMSWQEKELYFSRIINDFPLNAEKFVVQAQGGDWVNGASIIWTTFGNILCPHNAEEKRIVLDDMPADLPPHFTACDFFSRGNKGCQGRFDSHCQGMRKYFKSLWELIFYALVYINYPANIIIEESDELTTKEAAKFRRGKKPDAINPKKPRLRVVPANIILKLKRTREQRTHASPIPHLRTGHWRTLRDERFKRRWERIWIKDIAVGGELAWQSGKTRYKVVAPPTKKYIYV